MGESSCALPDEADTLTIESMAHDLLALLAHLGWQNGMCITYLVAR